MTGAFSDDHRELGFIIDLAAHLRNHDRFLGPDNRAPVHCEQQWLFWRLTFDFFYVIFVVQADADDFLRMRDRSAKRNIRGGEQKTLNSARRAFEISQLIREDREPVFDLKHVFNAENNAWKFQEVITDGFRDIKAGVVAENGPESDDIRNIFPGKVHEFHGYLL